ncbi:hypothetical protein COO91_01161 [Nostoc flagelliforme CCNUN1]|uniref:Uncharacterized protein n=1 Tax=Nostoc flagelliforme CCNUN1 TaxID=2038116 RepID=A0A2K8SKC5_9NOSO|nr:hypothetical protein COO91_01161 [Nostoc flagelliforme CCNUN1]
MLQNPGLSLTLTVAALLSEVLPDAVNLRSPLKAHPNQQIKTKHYNVH